jgi:hypothetical protein
MVELHSIFSVRRVTVSQDVVLLKNDVVASLVFETLLDCRTFHDRYSIFIVTLVAITSRSASTGHVPSIIRVCIVVRPILPSISLVDHVCHV